MNKNRTGLLFLFLWLFGAFLIYRGVRAAYEGAPSSRWPESPGQVIRSAARWERVNNGIRTMWAYHLDMGYEYEVNGRRYEGHRVSFSAWDPQYSLNLLNSWTAARYPAGTLASVHFDPLDPSRSVLEPGIQFSAWIAIILGIIFIRLSTGFRAQPAVIENAPSQKPTVEMAKSLALSGDLIAAIKIYRKATGTGLKESKDFIDAFLAQVKPK